MEAWADERRKVRIDEDQLISLIEQRKKKYMRKHGYGYDEIVLIDNKYVCINYGTGSHHYSHGQEVSKEVYDNVEIFNNLIKLLVKEKKS